MQQSAEETARGVMAKASGLAHEAADSMMHVASEGAHSISRQVSGLLDEQVATGAKVISQVANSTRMAANDLEETSPQVAGMVRSVADRIDAYADTIRDQTAEEMFETASDFARRQPAVVFGLGAMAGFLLFRALKSAPSSGGSSSGRRYASSDSEFGGMNREYGGMSPDV